MALDDPEEICRVASLLVQLLMPLLAGAALGGDQTETKQKNSEKSSQPIREPVGASRNLLAVKTATTTCIKAFFFFCNFCLFVFTLASSQFYLREGVSILNCVKRHIQAQGREASSPGCPSNPGAGDGRFGEREGITEWIGKCSPPLILS